MLDAPSTDTRNQPKEVLRRLRHGDNISSREITSLEEFLNNYGGDLVLDQYGNSIVIDVCVALENLIGGFGEKLDSLKIKYQTEIKSRIKTHLEKAQEAAEKGDYIEIEMHAFSIERYQQFAKTYNLELNSMDIAVKIMKARDIGYNKAIQKIFDHIRTLSEREEFSAMQISMREVGRLIDAAKRRNVVVTAKQF
ncbi:MAG: hypothetical protein PHO48_04640 [Candidatus Gracilibacteria bacterium]|nr:hypothetical protein [Candidatus Gracilibacteria bacterium]